MNKSEYDPTADILSKDRLIQIRGILRSAGHWGSIEETEAHQPCGVPLCLKKLIDEEQQYGVDPNVIKALKELRSHKILAIGMGCD